MRVITVGLLGVEHVGAGHTAQGPAVPLLGASPTLPATPAASATTAAIALVAQYVVQLVKGLGAGLGGVHAALGGRRYRSLVATFRGFPGLRALPIPR